MSNSVHIKIEHRFAEWRMSSLPVFPGRAAYAIR